MRFWSAFHKHALDIVSDFPRKLVLRTPNHIRLRMTIDHLGSSENPGSCLTHFNHNTCLWECYHSPATVGPHRLFIWILDLDRDKQWTRAVRFDVHIQDPIKSLDYPVTTDMFNTLQCQLITPIDGILVKESLPSSIIVRVPCVRDVQLQIDEQTIVTGKVLPNDTYKLKIPSLIPHHVTSFVLMGLCSDDLYYSILITYKIK